MAFKDKEKMVEYCNGYNKENYDRLTVLLPKGEREELEKIAGKRKVGAFIRDAIYEKLRKDGR